MESRKHLAEAKKRTERTTAHKPCAALITTIQVLTRKPLSTQATVLLQAWEICKVPAVPWLVQA